VKANTFNIDNSRLNTINESKIAGNDINVQAAIIMRFSNNNKFYRNNITGVILEDSNNNIFFENNIVLQHTSIIGESGNNLWDNGSFGNYWSDYSTKYPNGSEIGNSGIGDTPYVIDADNVDNFPLMAPFEVPPALTPSPEPQPEPESFPTALIAAASGASITGVAVCVFYYRKKRNH
jgi:nitrous oxidase accessory protein NosD